MISIRISAAGSFEEIVLLAVQLHSDYMTGITDAIGEFGGITVSRGAVWTTLDRLVKKGWLDTWMGQPSPIRGGRRKRHYKLTESGQKVLCRAEAMRTKGRG